LKAAEIPGFNWTSLVKNFYNADIDQNAANINKKGRGFFSKKSELRLEWSLK
jgi:hypothetical protein